MRKKQDIMRLNGIYLIAILSGTAALGSTVSRATDVRAYSILAVEEMLGRVTILAADDTRRRISVPVGFKPHEIVVSPDGKTAYVSNFGLNDADNRSGIPGETVSVIDIGSARVSNELHLPKGLKAPHGLGFRPQHGEELFVNAEQGDQMVVFDPSRSRMTRMFPLPSGIHNFVFSNDGNSLFAFASAGVVYRIDTDSGQVRAARDMGAPVRGLAWTYDGQQLIAAVKGEIVILNPTNLSTAKRFPLPDAPQAFYCAASKDGRMIFVPSVINGTVTVLSALNGALIKTLRVGTPLRVVLSPDPDLAYVANVSPRGSSITILRIPSLVTEEIGDLRDVNGLAFSSIRPTALGVPAH
jgi:DNA-binding beta-propeller fold protein YncE